jgi:cob(I)alamin adenosyltransferase
MSQSNARKSRKHYAEMVENELLTIQHDLSNLELNLQMFTKNELKRINVDHLKDVRQRLQTLQSNVRLLNYSISNISKLHSFGNEILEVDGVELIVKRSYSN